MISGNLQGKPSLYEDGPFQPKECCEHCRREINEAVETEKTVIVYMSELETVYFDIGKRTYTGTGRNHKTTRIMDEYHTFKSIPTTPTPIIATGNAIKN
jgi:hypothetical protein